MSDKEKPNVVLEDSMSLFCTRLRGFHLACTTITASFTFAIAILLDESTAWHLTERYQPFEHVYAFMEVVLTLGIAFAGGNYIAFVALSLGVSSFKEQGR